ncbi:MAG: replicative DNA helicase [Rikenellaceae bacterium]
METYNNEQITNIATERAVLGAIIIEPSYLPDVMGIISDPDTFTDPLNRTIYEVIRTKYEAGDTVDLVTLASNPKLKGSVAYLAQLTQTVGSGSSCIVHSRIITELLIRRKLTLFATELVSKAISGDDVGDVMGWAQSRLDETLGVVTIGSTPRHIKEILSETLTQVEERAKAFAKGEPTGIFTGLIDLDNATGGWKGGQLIILAGRPAMGKSAVMLHFAKSAAQGGVPVVVFSLEMKGRELGDRLILGGSGVEANRYKVGDISTTDWSNIERANTSMSYLPISIGDSSAMTMQKIKAQCQQLKAKGQCEMVIVDYLQLLGSEGRNKSNNREREVAEITRQAKVMANELDVPVILLSQLSRKVEERANKTPLLSDLRESGAIEQDADVVMFIHRPSYYGDVTIDTQRWGLISSENVGVLTVAKQRNGRCGATYFRHSPDLNRITDYSNDGTLESEAF